MGDWAWVFPIASSGPWSWLARRVRYRLRSAPMQVAQQFLAALARDWDSALGALGAHLDQ
jgi:hypothetical protein